MLNIFYKLKFNLNTDDWKLLSANPNAICFLDDNYYIKYQQKNNKDKIIYNKKQIKIDWEGLSSNPKAIHILEQNLDKVCWKNLSGNPNAIHILEKNLNKVSLDKLAENPNAIHIFEANIDKIDNIRRNANTWCSLLSNPGIIDFLEKNQNQIYYSEWLKISCNSNPKAIKMIENNLDKINWPRLSGNPNAIHILEANQDKICWDYLSLNPNAIHLLEANPYKIFWPYLSQNPNGIHLLEANPDKIDWHYLIYNPNAVHLLKANREKIKHNYFGTIYDMEMLLFNKNIKVIDLINPFLNKQYREFKKLPKFLCEYPHILSIILECNYERIKTHFYSTYGKELIEWIYNPQNYEKWGKSCWDL